MLPLLFVCGCGPQTVHRPIELFISGLSGRADSLVVLIFVESERSTCGDVTLDTVQDLDSKRRVQWQRGEGRGLALPEVDEGAVVLVAFSEDAGGTAIQFVCTQIDYADIESPDVTIELSARAR